VKALACALPHESGLPLSRWSCHDIASEAVGRGIVASISGATVWRWLSADAIRPWRYRSWIFPRDPGFQEKAGRVLDLYQGFWEDEPLGPADYVISADEKTSIQARNRRHATLSSAPGEPMRVEHEYPRKAALAYLAAWDVRRAKLFGRGEAATGWTAPLGLDGMGRDVALSDEAGKREPHHGSETKIECGLQAAGGGGGAGRRGQHGAAVPAL